MRTFAEFQIFGHVSTIKQLGPTLHVNLAAEYGRRDEAGEFKSNTYWNEVTLFGDRLVGWAKENVKVGDLVHARGTIRQTSYEKDGRIIYGVTLAASDFDLLASKAADPGQ